MTKRAILSLCIGIIISFSIISCNLIYLKDMKKGETGHDLSVDQLINIIDNERNKIKSIKAIIRGRIKDKGISLSFYSIFYFFSGVDQNLIEEKEGESSYLNPLWRLKVFGPAGTTLFDIILIEDRFKLFIPSEDRIVEGDTKDSNDNNPIFPFINTISMIGLPPLGLVSINKGEIPLLEVTNDSYLLSLSIYNGERRDKILKRRFWMKRDSLLTYKEEIFDRSGDRDMLILFKDYKRLEGTYLPYSVIAEREREDTSIYLQFQEILLNRPLKRKDFELTLN